MAPKRRAAAAVPSEEEYEVDSEVSSSEISSPEVSSSDEDASQDWAPAAQGKTRAASRRSRRPSYEVQQARRGREKALKKLQSARKASTAKTNTRSKPRRRAPIDVSSEEEYQQESSEDSEYKESSEEEEEKPPPKRNRRAARALMRPVAMPKPRRGGALVTGERDYVHSDEDFSDGLSDFIASEGEEEAVSSSEESDAAPKPSNREDASDSGGGPPANMQKARKATVKAKAAPAKPASKKRAPEVVVLEDESSSEPERKGGVIEDSSSEEDARDKKGATGRQPHRPASKGAKPLGKRQRLVKAKSLSSEKLSAENKGKQPMEAPSQAAAPKRTVLNAAERIRLAQEALMSQVQDEKVTIEYDSEGNEVVKLLPDEGEPSASAEDSGSLSDDSDSGGDDGSDGDGEGEAVVPARSPNFEKASAMMGTAPMTERQLFEVYVEYLVMCYIDPEYRATAAASEQHRAQYGKAIKKIEFELAAAREAVHSEAWRSCTLGLLEAVETLPGADSEWNPDAGEYTNWREIGDGRCDACNRGKSHPTRWIIFKGHRIVAPPENEGEAWEWDSSLTNRRLSSDYLKVSPVYQKKRPAPHTQRSRFQFATQADRDREERRKSGRHRLRRIDEEEEDEVEGEYDDQEESENEEEQNGGHEEASFAVGSACAARLLLYHGLFHWKRRLMARIKLELKKELRRRRHRNESTDPVDVADAILKKESLMNALYDHYQAALSLSEPYKLAGGEGTQRDFSGHMHTRVIHALAALHDDSEGEESSVDWEASAQEDEENEQESGHSEEAEVISIEEEEEEEPPLEDDRGGRAGSGSQDGGRMHTPQRQRFTSRPRAKSAKKGGQAAAAAVAAAAAERAAQSVQSPSAVATHSSPGGSGERRTRQLDIRTFLGPSSQENE